MAKVVEEQVRTYMLAGVTGNDLRASEAGLFEAAAGSETDAVNKVREHA
jgi:hypothetical protein